MNVTETTTEFALTTMQIKALKRCDTLCFLHSRDKLGGSIRADRRKKGDYCTIETTTTVECRSSIGLCGVACANTINRDTLSAFEMLFAPQYSEEWQTIVSLLRVGDEIELRWVANDTNGYLRRATVTDRDENSSAGFGEKLTHDKLYLHICHKGKRKYSFYLCDQICPNNTARMIKGL